MLRFQRLARHETVEPSKEEGVIFLFARGGRGAFDSKLSNHLLSQGDTLLFNAAESCRLSVPNGSEEFLFWTFSASFEILSSLFESEEFNLLHQVIEKLKQGRIYLAGTPLALQCQRLLAAVPPECDLNHRGQLLRIAATLLSPEFAEELSLLNQRLISDERILPAMEKLSASELVNLSVSELATRYHCSRRQLCRLFHRYFGVPVVTLRMEARLLKAIYLLRDTESKVKHIARECGFQHFQSFDYFFKRRFGVSPGRWRKSSAHSGNAPTDKTGHKVQSLMHESHIRHLLGPANASMAASVPSLRENPEDEDKFQRS